MKKLLSLLLSLSLALILFGCGRGETEPTELESVEATQVTEPPTETAEVIEETQSPVPEGMVCLEDVIAGSDIVMTVEGEKITLEEDGLVLELSTQWKLGHRNGYAVAALQSAPQILEGKVYVEEWFCKYFLGAEELEQPTLFHQIQFFAGEILEAIEEPEASEFNRKLIQQVFQPGSMGIETPHINMGRYFSENPLENYPDALKAELESMDYGHAFLYVYGEYLVISDSKMMDRVFIETVRQSSSEFDNVPLESMTVGEYSRLRRALDQQISIDNLTEDEKAFAEEKGIVLSDFSYLRSVFYSDYRNQSDDALKAVLEGYYQNDINYLKDAAGRE